MLMALESPIEQKVFSKGFWEAQPVDVIMDKARKLLEIGDDFLAQMKQLLVEGKIHVRAMNRHGKSREVKDPDVIDFDELTVTPSVFFQWMMSLPPEVCNEG
jgi:hypothetical protein